MFLSSAGFRRHVVVILTKFTNPWGDYLQPAALEIKKTEKKLAFVCEEIGFATSPRVLVGFGRLGEMGRDRQHVSDPDTEMLKDGRREPKGDLTQRHTCSIKVHSMYKPKPFSSLLQPYNRHQKCYYHLCTVCMT